MPPESVRVMTVDAERPRVLLCMPTRGDARLEAAQSHLALATRGLCDVIPSMTASSLLANGFNRMWATALNFARVGAVTHWLLHHDDIEIRTPGWLDVMVEEMQRVGAAVLSVVQPIKNNSGLTSTAVGLPGDPWFNRKFKLSEIAALPETFSAADTRWPQAPLLANTGLMLIDLSRPEWTQTNPDGSLRFRFQISDRIVEEGGEYKAQVRPEDWAFSRDCWEAGLPVYVTRKVDCHHWGAVAFSNQYQAETPPAPEHYYRTIEGWFDFEDLYREAIERTPDGGTLVEVGCWKGKSLSFLLVEARKSEKRLRVYGIDHFLGSADQADMLERAQESDLYATCVENARRSGHGDWHVHRLASVPAAAEFTDGSLDFVFIDASHTYASVCEDIAAWLPKVKPGGVLAGHDADESGVNSAIARLLPGAKIKGRCWWYDVPN